MSGLNRSDFGRAAQAQRGVATLVVVMVLFFIVSLVAAYTSRNMIFEQRTSANQYRSTQAIEAAEAGVEWALAMLNHQRLTATCTNSTLVADTTFRERYLITNAVTGGLTPKTMTGGGTLSSMCVLNGTQWDCSCPADSSPSLTAPSGAGVNPAFRIRFQQIGLVPATLPPSQPGVIRLQVVGCTRLDIACLDFDGQGVTNEGRAVVTQLVALTGNVASAPAAALLARGNVDFGSAVAAIYNTSSAGTGITVHTGGTINGGTPINVANLVLRSQPGTPAAQSLVASDPALNLVALTPFSAEDRMFASVFNMTASTFQSQPAAVAVPCTAGICTAAQVRTVVAMNPGRPIWVQGDLSVTTAGDIGSAAAPVLVVVNGNLTFPVNATVYGLVYLRTANWATSGTGGQIQGAAVAEGEISGSGSPTIIHDREVLTRLRGSVGSFVRAPGSWKDFR